MPANGKLPPELITFQDQRSCGMARAEYLLALGLLVAILSIALPAGYSWNSKNKVFMARNDVLRIVRACYEYFDATEKWPTMHDGAYGDYRYGEWMPNALVMNVLRAVDGPGNEGHHVNTERRPFLHVDEAARGLSGLDGKGGVLDPWGRPYQIVIDTDHDKNTYIERSAYGTLVGRNIAVWSYGPDGKPGTADDILSWKL